MTPRFRRVSWRVHGNDHVLVLRFRWYTSGQYWRWRDLESVDHKCQYRLQSNCAHVHFTVVWLQFDGQCMDLLPYLWWTVSCHFNPLLEAYTDDGQLQSCSHACYDDRQRRGHRQRRSTHLRTASWRHLRLISGLCIVPDDVQCTNNVVGRHINCSRSLCELFEMSSSWQHH